jgi:hypothetical protein
MKRLSGLAFAEIAVRMRVRAPGMSLVLASHEPFLVLRRCMGNMTSAANEHICVVISRWSCNRPNMLPLSRAALSAQGSRRRAGRRDERRRGRSELRLA